MKWLNGAFAKMDKELKSFKSDTHNDLDKMKERMDGIKQFPSNQVDDVDAVLKEIESEIKELKLSMMTISDRIPIEDTDVSEDMELEALSPNTKGLDACFAPFYNESGGHRIKSYKDFPERLQFGRKVEHDWIFRNPHSCHIPMEGGERDVISFNITAYVSGRLLLIESHNDEDYGQQYVIKISVPYREYEVMAYLSSFDGIRDQTVRVYPDRYPLLEWKDENIVIMEYLDDARALLYPPYIPRALGGLPMDKVIAFLLNCFVETQSVLDVLWEFEDGYVAHNDFHARNIMVSADYKCKLIDFGMLFSFKVEDDKPGSKAYRASGGLSPFAVEYLHSWTARNRLVAEYGKDEDTWRRYREYGYAAQQYKLRWTMLKAMMTYLDREELEEIGESKKVCEEDEWECIWCIKRKQTLSLIRILKREKKRDSGGAVQIGEFVEFASKFLLQLEHEVEATNVTLECPNRARRD